LKGELAYEKKANPRLRGLDTRKRSGEMKGTRNEFVADKFINIDRNVINEG